MNKILAFTYSASALVLAALASALTVTNGEVTFDTADNTAMNTAVSNGLSNLWAGFQFVLPYLGIAVGVIFVLAVGRKLVKGR